MTQASTNATWDAGAFFNSKGSIRGRPDAVAVEFINGTPANLTTLGGCVWVDTSSSLLKYTSDGTTIKTVSTAGNAIVSDSFNRANSASGLGTADTGQTWVADAGIIGIQSNQAYMPNTGTSITTINSNVANVAVQFTDVNAAVDTSLFVGVVVRYTDTSNYFRIVIQQTTLFIQRRQAGTTTTVAQTSITRNANDVYRIEASSAGITAFQNNVSLLSPADTFNNTATKQGIIMSTTLARIDNYSVVSL